MIKNGHHLEDTLKVIDLIKHDVDAITSFRGRGSVSPAAYPGYHWSYPPPSINGIGNHGRGMILSVEDAEKALQDHKADLIYLGVRSSCAHAIARSAGQKPIAPN
jgi:hypothetical protein